MRKLRLLTAAAVVIAISTVAVVFSAGPGSEPIVGAAAGASTVSKSAGPLVTVNAGNYTVDCTGFTGSASFNPALTPNGNVSVTKEKAKFTGSLSACTAMPTAGGKPVSISGGTVSGTLKYKRSSFANSCGPILVGGNVAFKGLLTVTWSSSPALRSTTSVLSVKSVNDSANGGNTPSTYIIPGSAGSTVSGSFTGGNAGIDSVFQITGSQSPEQLGIACISSGGLTSLPITSGYLDLGAPPGSIALQPNFYDNFLEVGDSDNYLAVGTFPGGTQVDITAPSSWLSSNTAVLTVQGASGGSTEASVKAIAAGSSTLSAKFGSTTGSVGVTVVPKLNVTTSSLPDSTVGTSYDQTLAATGGTQPYSWSIPLGSLPNGLNLNTSTGEITGMPTTAGCSQFTVEVADSSSRQLTNDANLSIGVDNGTTNGCLQITTTSLPSGMVGQPYNTTLAATGGTTPYTWSDPDNILPGEGLSLNSSTGQITGTPSQAGSFCFIAQVTDSSSPQQSNSLQLCGSFS